MKLKIDCPAGKSQPDPFIFHDGDRYYLYVTARDGAEAYSAADPFGTWTWEGIVCLVPGCRDYWAPCIYKKNGWYYLYFSCSSPDFFENLHVARSRSPLGPFTDPKRLYTEFSIDAHVVETDAGLYLWYAKDNLEGERIGTRIFLDRLPDPMTAAGAPREMLVPTLEEEIFQRDRNGDGRDWYTLEGPFWFRRGGWQYLTYSGACFLNDTYHIGYAAARSEDPELSAVTFEKHTDAGAFSPLMIRSGFEEGVGHHSILEYRGGLFVVYHARDYLPAGTADDGRDRRTARICRLEAKDGVLTARPASDRV